MKHGFIKVAAAAPKVTVADCEANLRELLRLHRSADSQGVHLLVFPELSVTGATCGDLFTTGTLLSSAENALGEYLKETKDSSLISIIGFPLVVNDKIYNSAAICQLGQILGVVPKQNLPNYGEFVDRRYFELSCGACTEISVCGQTVPFGARQIFACREARSFRFGVEIGNDRFAAIPPSSALTAAGALLIANPSAIAETVGSAEFRRMTVTSQSARTVSGYVTAESGVGESTTDLVYGGAAVIAENGVLLAERPAFSAEELLITEIDTEFLSAERRKMTSDAQGADLTATTVYFSLQPKETALTRKIDAHPFIPSAESERATRAETVLNIQAHGLATRTVRAYAKKLVIGISGGLDSCLAILVAARALDLLGRPRTDIIGVTMPCFGTTSRTKSNAELLCAELGAELRCVDIGKSVRSHFADIGHDEANRNVVYENAQARERTQVIMDIANMENGLVVGTGDLSELALGWATYNGDHMSMYGVNGAVPKTLIRHVVAYCADSAEDHGQKALAEVLRDILNTPVSPELLPAEEDGTIAQRTEDLVGPYELHDFYLYYMLRRGYAPDKLYRVAKLAFAGQYSDEVLLKWLKNFVRRFFAQQFKRSCLPDGPKVGSVGFSPRGDWKMPSDASARAWMKIAEQLD